MKYNQTPTTLFVIFLVGLVHNTHTQKIIQYPHHSHQYYDPNQYQSRNGFGGFLQRLETVIGESSSNCLPFTVKDHVIDKLKETSYEFKDLCQRYEVKSLEEEGRYSTLSSLNQTIYFFFYYYKESANSQRDKLEIIESMDPIGFHVYLAKRNIDEKSLNFQEYVESFTKEMYQKFPLENSIYHLGYFMEFLHRLETKITDSSLPFKKKKGVIESLKETSDEFKDLCLRHENKFKREHGNYSPLASLKETIDYFFWYYKESAKEKGKEFIIEKIESVDPVGFCAFLNKKHENGKSPKFVQTAEEFRKLMSKKLDLTDSGKYTNGHFDEYLQRLEESIKSSSVEVLPFMAKHHLIKRLKETSGSFAELCIGYEIESEWKKGYFSPIVSLTKAISNTFGDYRSSCGIGYKKKLKRIKLVDPIGFNIYLTERNVSETSSSVKDFVDGFHATMYEKAPIENSSYHLSDFMKFIERLKKRVEASSLDILPFALKVHVSKSLMETSNEFMKLCILNEFDAKRKKRNVSPVTALDIAIKSIFSDYKKSTTQNRRLLEEMERVDPIGFHVYIMKNNIKVSSPTLVHSIEGFKTTLHERVRLFNSRKDDSYIEVYDHNKGLHEISEVVRTAVTSEYKPFCDYTIDFFADLAMEQFPNIKFYYLHDYYDVLNYKPHKSRYISDVQILYGFPGPYEGAHAICIYYQASSQNVLVYDSAFYENLDPTQREIIDRLYPFKRDIVYKTPKTRQDSTPTCAVFSTIYATMLLLGYDPADYSFRLNDIYGDDTIYMRLHILNMFANRKLALMK